MMNNAYAFEKVMWNARAHSATYHTPVQYVIALANPDYRYISCESFLFNLTRSP